MVYMTRLYYLFLLILAAIFSEAFVAATPLPGCPRYNDTLECQCDQNEQGTSLSINCANSHMSDQELSQQLESLLSADNITGRLTSLTIRDTPLTQVPASVCQLLNLTSLRLNHNKLANFSESCFAKMSKLTTLEATDNELAAIADGVFGGLRSLQTLKLCRNNIAEIGHGVFSNSSVLSNLRHIDLCCNSLTSLEPWWYVRSTLGSPVQIFLHGNLISNFTNHMNVDFRCGMAQPCGTLDLTQNPIAHVTDFLRGVGVDRLEDFKCLRNFRSPLTPLACMNFYLGSSQNWTFACDCTDYWLYEWVRIRSNSNILTGVLCDVSHMDGSSQQAEAAALPLEYFVCESNYRCPPGCQCVCRPANATLHVDCSAANVSSLPLDLPPLRNSCDRYKLDFSNNKLLRSLEYRSYFANTAILDVRNCAVEDIDVETWRAFGQMHRVYLQDNQLKTFTPEVMATNFDDGTSGICLGNNPWSCSCKNDKLRQWFQSANNRLLYPKSILCHSPARLHGKNILQVSETEFCDNSLKKMTTSSGILGSLSGFIFISVCVAAVAYRLRVKLYTTWKYHPFDRDECSGEDMDYDVFLCCSSEDHEPDGLHIMELLESKGYRVCYHLRDFVAGKTIAENMCQAVVSSRRSVCLLSRHFLNSTFCMMEFDMAFHHLVALKRKKRLIVLMMLDSLNDLYANDSSNTATLRHHVRQYTYIDYKADDWLDKLLYALPLHGLLQTDQQNSDDDVQLLEQYR